MLSPVAIASTGIDPPAPGRGLLRDQGTVRAGQTLRSSTITHHDDRRVRSSGRSPPDIETNVGSIVTK